MLLFEFEGGNLFAAQLGTHGSGDVAPEVMEAVRDHVLEIIGRPLFPVRWAGSEGAHVAREEPHRLIAMDPSGQVVSVEVTAALDSVSLVETLARSGRTSALGWLELAEMYPQGVACFRRDWNAFRESMPPRQVPGPRLCIVTGLLSDDVRPAIDALADTGVEVFEVAQRDLSDGRTFVQVTEPVRVGYSWPRPGEALGAGDRPPLVIEQDADFRRIAPAPEPLEVDEPESRPDLQPAKAASAEPAASADFSDVEGEIMPGPQYAVRSALGAAEAEQFGTPSGMMTPEPVPADFSQPPSRVVSAEEARPALAEESPEPQESSSAPKEPSPEPVAQGPEPQIPSPEPVVVTPDPALAAIASELEEPVKLVWVQLRKGRRHEAELQTSGLISLGNGRVYTTPDDAAFAVSGRNANGWRVWRIEDDGPSLFEARAELERPRNSGRRRA